MAGFILANIQTCSAVFKYVLQLTESDKTNWIRNCDYPYQGIIFLHCIIRNIHVVIPELAQNFFIW